MCDINTITACYVHAVLASKGPQYIKLFHSAMCSIGGGVPPSSPRACPQPPPPHRDKLTRASTLDVYGRWWSWQCHVSESPRWQCGHRCSPRRAASPSGWRCRWGPCWCSPGCHRPPENQSAVRHTTANRDTLFWELEKLAVYSPIV